MLGLNLDREGLPISPLILNPITCTTQVQSLNPGRAAAAAAQAACYGTLDQTAVGDRARTREAAQQAAVAADRSDVGGGGSDSPPWASPRIVQGAANWRPTCTLPPRLPLCIDPTENSCAGNPSDPPLAPCFLSYQ